MLNLLARSQERQISNNIFGTNERTNSLQENILRIF